MSENSSPTRWCAKCGAEMPAGDTGTVCAGCALAAALDTSGGHGETIQLNLQDIPAPGEKISYIGDYELMNVIAQGGMGVVYKARQRTLNREVALKLLLGGAHASKDFKKRFLQEAETAGKLQHPNIVPIYEVGEHEGQPFFSMEYVAGSDLSNSIREQPMPPKKAAECVKTVSEAIEYAHQQGILHRDLKPSNILVGPDGRLRITDFGLARETKTDSSLTLTGTTLGTPGFMPPEQVSVKRGEVGPVSDVYSLGAVLYCLITGRAPFAAGTLADILQQVVGTEPVSPRQLNPAVPRDLETICLKCLEKEPRRRYSSAQALADDLGRFIRGEPIVARPVGFSERVLKWYRREPMIAGLVTAVVFVLLVGFGVSSWQWQVAKKARNFAENQRQRAEGLNSSLVTERDVANNARKVADEKRREAEQLRLDLQEAQAAALKARSEAKQRALEAEASFQEAARAIERAQREGTNAAPIPANSIVDSDLGQTNLVPTGSSAALLAKTRAKAAETALLEAQAAAIRADEAERVFSTKLAASQQGSPDYVNTASEASAAMNRASQAREKLVAATKAYETASHVQAAVVVPAGPPTISVARTDGSSLSSWQPTMGEGLAHMLITELTKLTNFSVLESVALDDLRAEQGLGANGEVSAGESVKKGQWKGADYTLKTTVTRFGSKENNYGGNAPGGLPFRAPIPFIGGLGVSIKKSENEVQIDWRIIDNASRVVIKGASGRAVGVEKGTGFNISSFKGGGFNDNSEFMESALGKATMKALSQIMDQVQTLSLPPGARTINNDAAAVAGLTALRNIKGTVLLVENKEVWVSLGSNNGFDRGDRIKLYRPVEKKNSKGEVVAVAFQTVGEIILSKVQKDKSMGEHIGSTPVSEGWAAAEANLDIDQL